MTFFFAGEAATSQQFRESETPLILLSRSIMKNGSPERPDALAASNGIRNEVRSRSFSEANSLAVRLRRLQEFVLLDDRRDAYSGCWQRRLDSHYARGEADAHRISQRYVRGKS